MFAHSINHVVEADGRANAVAVQAAMNRPVNYSTSMERQERVEHDRKAVLAITPILDEMRRVSERLESDDFGSSERDLLFEQFCSLNRLYDDLIDQTSGCGR